MRILCRYQIWLNILTNWTDNEMSCICKYSVDFQSIETVVTVLISTCSSSLVGLMPRCLRRLPSCLVDTRPDCVSSNLLKASTNSRMWDSLSCRLLLPILGATEAAAGVAASSHQLCLLRNLRLFHPEQHENCQQHFSNLLYRYIGHNLPNYGY